MINYQSKLLRQKNQLMIIGESFLKVKNANYLFNLSKEF